MLLVLALCGYQVDGLTQSTVLAINEVVKTNKHVAVALLTMSLAVALLVWICGAARHLGERLRDEREVIRRDGDGHLMMNRRTGDSALVNTGGR